MTNHHTPGRQAPDPTRDQALDQALVLDFGGVISRTLFETHAATEAALGLAPGTLTWRGPFDPEGDALWRAQQAGQISERDYWLTRARETGRLLGEDWTAMADLVRRARGNDPQAVLRPQALAAIDTARVAGVRLAILSNELDLFYGSDFRDRLPLLQAFECIVDASHTGVLKPDPRAYQAVTDALGLAPQACVFVDDQARNIAGAQALGWRTVHLDVRDPSAGFASALEQLGLAGPA